jgi:N-acyl-D-amino-acid deacylase
MYYYLKHMESEILIKNGKIFDGTGNPWFKGDLSINGELISNIGNIEDDSFDMVIDASNLVVCPGFIDVHSHSDLSFLINNKADSKIRQGVTTEFVGVCGSSAAPLTEKAKIILTPSYEKKGVKCSWSSVAEYLNLIESKGIPLNFGMFIGHGSVRASVIGYEAREPNKEELEMMKKLVYDGMQDGAFGLSTGLKYAPGCYAKTEEIIELCNEISKFGGIYSTHLRNQGALLVESTDEAIKIGTSSGTSVIISHLKAKGRDNWGKASNVLRIIDEARKNGTDVTFDQYPYPAGSSNLISRAPSWAREGGPSRLLERLKDPEIRMRIEKEITQSEDWLDTESTFVAQFTPDPSLEGKSLEELSKIRGKSPETVVCDLLLEANGIVPVISFYGWDKDVREIMTHRVMMVGSDGSSLSTKGILGQGKPHPRSYGTFPRFFGKYVIQEKIMSIEDGIRRMTSNPATRMGLKRRGLLKDNMFADVLVINTSDFIDIATFSNPHQYPKGIVYAFVNGTLTVENDDFTGNLGGKVLRHNH